jgi:hypothetical protein
MKYHLSPNPLRTLLIILSIGLLLTIVDACRKIDLDKTPGDNQSPTTSEKFFKMNGEVTPVVMRIVNALKQANLKHEFAPNLARLGYPVWDKCPTVYGASTNFGPTEDTLVFVPMIDEDSLAVTSFLACIINEDSIKIKLFNAFTYKDYGYDADLATNVLSAETIASTSMLLELYALNHDTFNLHDANLYDFPSWTNNSDTSRRVIVDIDGGDNRDNILISYTERICFTIREQRLKAFRSNNTESDDPIELCYTTTFWEEIITNNPAIVMPSSGGGSSGSSFQQVNCTNFPGPECFQTPYQGWSPHITQPAGAFNPYKYDSIGVSTGLETIFPCFAALLKDSISLPNTIATIAGMQLFKDSVYSHLTFDTSLTLTADSLVYAYTKVPKDSIWVDGDGHLHFSAVIEFNPGWLRESTREMKVAVAIHEMMHAIFKFRLYQYKNNTAGIDSNFMKQHFPTYWANISQNPNYFPTSLAEHELMATRYRNKFIALVKPFYNPNAPSNIRDTVLEALSYSGIGETQTWKLLPSRGKDTCKYKNIEATAAWSFVGTGTLNGCSSFTTHYADSLKLRTGCN